MIRSDLILPLIKVFLLSLTGLVVLLVAEKRWKLLSTFRVEASSALNLAATRIVVISVLVSKINLAREIFYSKLDKSLIIPPVGWSHIAPYLPRSPHIVMFFYGLFVAFGALAIAGLYGRLACFITSATGFYLLTIPQLFGKINHDHNLILFGLVLATSPCCDTLSVDAIREALRAGRRGNYVEAPKESTAYADPLKIMMVLMGLIYFFPGAWKVGRLGMHWFSADNMRWTMARKLLETSQITSIQTWAMHHSLLLLAGATFTPVFELGFIFAVFSRYTRPIAAACGIAFHNLTGILMNIRFLSLQLCYVIFVDWTYVLGRLAQRFDCDRISVSEIGHGQLPLLNIVSNLDWLNLVSMEIAKPSRESELILNNDAHRLTIIDKTGKRMSGYGAYISIMRRIVFLWPLSLCLSMGLVRKSGAALLKLIYRHRRIQGLKTVKPTETSHCDPRTGLLFWPISAAFIIGMFLAGLSHTVDSWPIACYPTFDHLETGEFRQLSAIAIGGDGKIYRDTLSFNPKVGADLSPERYDAMVESVMRQDAPASKERATALVNLWREKYQYPSFREVTLDSSIYAFDSDGKAGRLIENREVTHLDKNDGLE
jgi:hypothetical protein